MRITRLATAAGIGSAGVVIGAAVAERLLLRRMDGTAPPPDWRTPRWPSGTRMMVPTSDGAELVVEISGDPAQPTIVLVHGLSGDHESWGPVATPLVDRGFHVIGINQRGHGGSTIGTDGFGPQRQGADVGQVLRALDLRDVTLIGHSMGGLAAMALMTLTPESGAERVAALGLVATLADAARPDRAWSLRVGGADWYRRLGEHPIHAPVLARGVFGPGPSRAMIDDILDVAHRCPTEVSVAASRGMIGCDIRDRLSEIDLPTVVVCGTRDLLTSHRENQAIAAAIPFAEIRTVPGAGHMVIWEEPAVVVDAAVELAGSIGTPAANA